jgi:hypothetical protein
MAVRRPIAEAPGCSDAKEEGLAERLFLPQTQGFPKFLEQERRPVSLRWIRWGLVIIVAMAQACRHGRLQKEESSLVYHGPSLHLWMEQGDCPGAWHNSRSVSGFESSSVLGPLTFCRGGEKH